MNLNSRHFAILGSTAIGVMNIAYQGSSEVTLAAIGIMSGAFVWDKIEKNLSSRKQ